MLTSCAKEETKYDVAVDDIPTFIYENCLKEYLEIKTNGFYIRHKTNYYFFYEYTLPQSMTKEEVTPWMEELKSIIIETCRDLSFEPANSFLNKEYTVLYVDLNNPKNKKDEYPLTPGAIRIQTEYFPIKNEEDIDKAVLIY